MYRISPFMQRFALALGAGVVLATIWVNLHPASYYDMVEWRILELQMLRPLFPTPPSLTPLNLIAEVLIPFFMFLIGKELYEAIVLERGGFSGPSALLPIAGTLGAALGAALIWRIGAEVMDPARETLLATGWPMPIGGDVVLVYILGRWAFDWRSNALRLLLLVMIALDMLGLVLLGLTHPNGGLLRLAWLALPLAAALTVWALLARPVLRAEAAGPVPERLRRRAGWLWPYALAGIVSYAGVIAAGLPGALGLLPIVPAMVHADRSFGLFAEAEELLQDPLNRMAHALIHPITAILFVFGITRGGIDLQAYAPPTLLVLAAYWLGKPAGFLLGTWAALRIGGAELPQDLHPRALLRVALLLGIGFTVPVLALDTALDGGEVAEAARLGLGATLGIALLALLLPRR
jgi:Na+:H+ antiporter, NhaA family